MNLEERLNALLAWMDEPVSAGLTSEAAQRVLGRERAEQLSAAVPEKPKAPEPTVPERSVPLRSTESEGASRPEGRAAMQTEYDIVGLRRECLGRDASTRILGEELPRVDDTWQTRKPAAMEPGQLDLFLRTNLTSLSQRQRSEMTALQQCGLVPDQQMRPFLQILSLLNEPATPKELKRLMEQIERSEAFTEGWQALIDALNFRMLVQREIKNRRIGEAEEQARIREAAYRQAAAEYERTKAESIRILESIP